MGLSKKHLSTSFLEGHGGSLCRLFPPTVTNVAGGGEFPGIWDGSWVRGPDLGACRPPDGSSCSALLPRLQYPEYQPSPLHPDVKTTVITRLSADSRSLPPDPLFLLSLFLLLCVLAPFFCSEVFCKFFFLFPFFFYKLICFPFHLVDAFCVALPVAVRQGDWREAAPGSPSSSIGRGCRDAGATPGQGSPAVGAEQLQELGRGSHLL